MIWEGPFANRYTIFYIAITITKRCKWHRIVTKLVKVFMMLGKRDSSAISWPSYTEWTNVDVFLVDMLPKVRELRINFHENNELAFSHR